MLRPEPWMLEGTWTIVLKYKDLSKGKHEQILDYVMDTTNPFNTVLPVQNVKFQPQPNGSIIVSWSAVGDPCEMYVATEPAPGPMPMPVMMYRFHYRVLVYSDGVCPIAYNGSQMPFVSHSPVTHRISIMIPPGNSGKKIRIENMFYGSTIPNRSTARSGLTLNLP